MESPFVYVVDDEPGIAMLCDRVLTRAGYRVATETNPRKAVDYFEDNPIDLLLVDIRMPDVDGFEVIQHVQRWQPDAAILIMTGHGTVDTAIRALRQGVDGLILKPFKQGAELVDAVQLAFADNQKKRDAARTQALRPLFAITESLLSERRQAPLLDLIIKAIGGQLSCSQAACYQKKNDVQGYTRLAARGASESKPLMELLARATTTDSPILINIAGPGDHALKALLADLELGSAILAPVRHPSLSTVFFAARGVSEPAFRESDLEMFQILARQAATALENSRLYAEQLEYVRQIEASQKALIQAEKMAAAGRLSASIAHEINNPLQAVQNCLHLAGRNDLPEEKRKEYFDLARTELERLMVTARRMLDFYRPNAVTQTKVNLVDMLEYVLSLMAKQMSEAKVNVIKDIRDDLPLITAVGSQIQQVFINLILNAADAMAPEGGDLRITARTWEDGVEFLFQDSGKGISSEEQANIFEPFFSTKDGGTGLGLTVSYNIITAHGGSLELLVDRAPGACFRILLPTGGTQ
ncbi:MAG: response regulator [Anaerolineales bacterium]|uniref:hybrid sensor histidine kinase/response regulator n=1 Tax=Candidatus Villigracilis vicinus TaxID=3140679 RepID=UPI003134DBAF|nr:response regulator [Anaerolineales bacterium]MBK9781496.1 response regulator [Anaerolineales bacterium]